MVYVTATVCVMILGGSVVGADTVQGDGENSTAAESAPIRDTNTVFEMTPFASKEDWESFATELRRRILVACGLWPMPMRTPLNPTVTGRIEHPDYIIENVYLEARPGFFVTGNLYRPVGDGPFPAVACPHGHWGSGRFEHSDLCSVPGRCITFARMGIVAFSYDMVGYNDSRQFSNAWGHSPSGIPIEERQREALWGVHPFAVQLWSSIRVLDYLESLPYVDKERLGCTGASGGGTQTFALSAVDPRVKAAAPVNMISHTMQGGCMCENAPLIRFTASNMEIGALAAPRPLLMISATGDWTKATPEVEFPAIRCIFALYDAADRIENHHIDAGHNYNRESREWVYRFFGKWLLNQPDTYRDFTEPAFTVEPVDALRVFPDERLPEHARSAEQIVADLIECAKARWNALLPESPAAVAAFRSQYGVALADALGASVPPPQAVFSETAQAIRGEAYGSERLTLGRKQTPDRISAVLFTPVSRRPLGVPILLVHGDGIAGATGADGAPGPYVDALLRARRAVLVIDPFMIGAGGESPSGKFPDTFAPTDTARRVQDVLTASAWLRDRFPRATGSDLVGLGAGGMWALLASALDPDVRTTVVDLNRFDAADDAAWVETYYVPCIRSIGDVITASVLVSPRRLWMMNPADSFDGTLAARAFPRGAYRLLRDAPTPEFLVSALRRRPRG